jgi:hypothetical protein
MKIKDYKKKYAICKDNNGKTIYAGDTVRLHAPMEIKSAWESIVHWNMLDGAFVESHPSHIKMGMGSGHRELRYFIDQDVITIPDQDGKMHDYTCFAVKVRSFYK